MDTSAINRRLAHLNRWVTGAAIPEDPERGLRGKPGQGSCIARVRAHFFSQLDGAEWTLQAGADMTAAQAPFSNGHGGGYAIAHSGISGKYKPGDEVVPNPPAAEHASSGRALETRPINRSTAKKLHGYHAKSRSQRLASSLKTFTKEISKALGLHAQHAEAGTAPTVLRPARKVGDFTARLQEAFAGCSARDIEALNTKLDRIKGLMPDCGYQFALSMLEALSEGCYGNAVLAGKVLDDMERIRVISNADDHQAHDPTKAALELLSRMPPWLEMSKITGPNSAVMRAECGQALFRTAALLSDTRHTPHDYQAFCLATGLTSTRAIREESRGTRSPGAAGPHRLDLGGRDIGKRLVLIGLQALQQDYGQAHPDRLASRVITHVRKLGQMLGNEQFMAALPQAEPVNYEEIDAAQERLDLEEPSHLSELSQSQGDIEGDIEGGMDLAENELPDDNNNAAEKDFNLRVLRAKHRNETVARNRRIDIIIGIGEPAAEAGMPSGIGQKGFVDLMCWLNGMRTDADIERRGRKHIDGCVKPFLVCDELAKRPHMKHAGILRHLMVGSSALHALHNRGDADASRRHGDEDAADHKKTAGEILDTLRQHLCRNPPHHPTPDQAAILRACRIRYLLLRAAHSLPKDASPADQQIALLNVIAAEGAGAGVRPDNQAQMVQDYCRVFCPTLLEERQHATPANLMELVQRHILHNLKTDRSHLEALVSKCALPLQQEELLQDKLMLLRIIEEGNVMRGPGYTEDICKALQISAARRQDNSQKIVDGVSGGLSRVGVDIPLTPDGNFKLTIAAQLTGSDGHVLFIANENHATQIMFGREAGLNKVFNAGLGLSQDVGAATVTAGGEMSIGKETTKLSGCTISILRDAINDYDNPAQAGNTDAAAGTLTPGKHELAKRNVEHLGALGEFRAVEINIHELHALMANNPTNLTPEQLISLRYPEKGRPNVDLPEAARRIRPLDGVHLTEEQRKAMRHLDNKRLIDEMSGYDYFSRFFMTLRHDDHIVRVTETEQNTVTDKVNVALNAKFKGNLNGIVPAELKATAISHTHAHQVNHRRDVQGAINFEYLMNTVTESTTRGVSATLAAPDDTIGSDITMSGDGIGYTKRIGFMMERTLVKLLSHDEGGETFHRNTNTFHTYGGQNFSASNFDAFERAIKSNLTAWADVLRGRPLPPPPANETPAQAEARLEQQRKDDEALIDRKLAALRKMPHNQNSQWVLRYRLRASAGVKLDQLKTEIQHTEDTIRKTVEALHGRRRTQSSKVQLEARLASLQKTLYALHNEKLEVLGSGESWEAFGFGLGNMTAHTETSSGKVTEKMKAIQPGIPALRGGVQLTVSASAIQSFMEVNEVGWVKADAAYSDYNHRLGRQKDAREREERYLAALLQETSFQAVVDGLTGAIHGGFPPNSLDTLAQHAIDLLRSGPHNHDASINGPAPAAARAALCRHLLTLGNTHLIGQLIDEGHVTLRSLLEQAVHSRRIAVIEMLLADEIHTQEANAAAAADAPAPALAPVAAPVLDPAEQARLNDVRARRNFGAALQAMSENDRLELLYGLMVRDQQQGRVHDPEQLIQQPRYARTAWQGRTAAVEGAAARRAQQLDRAGVEWLIAGGHIQAEEALNLLMYKPNLRTLDLALQYYPITDGQLLEKLERLWLCGSTHPKYSSIDPVEFCLHTLNSYRNPRIAERMAENFELSIPVLFNKALRRDDTASMRKMFESRLVNIRALLADENVRLSEDAWIEVYQLRQSCTRLPMDRLELQDLLIHALKTDATRLLEAIGPQLCARMDAPGADGIEIGRLLRYALRHVECKQSTLEAVVDILYRHGRVNDLSRLLRDCLDNPQWTNPALFKALVRHNRRGLYTIDGLPMAQWMRRQYPESPLFGLVKLPPNPAEAHAVRRAPRQRQVRQVA